MAVAETVVQARWRVHSSISSSWRAAAYTTAIIASNIPDLDILYASVGGKLGYLEHHRGHTHTFAMALPLILLTLLYAYGWWRWRLALWDRRDAKALGVVATVSVLLHVSMDALNNYGVHPFWPVDNGWYYGDTLFIIEPWVWLALIPMIRPALKRRTWRLLWLLVFIAGIGLPYGFGLQPVSLAVGAAVAASCWWHFAARISGQARCVVGIASVTFIILTFAGTSRWVKSIVETQSDAALPGSQELQLVVTPMPSNPVCWSVIDVRADAAREQLILRTATVSLWPLYQPAATCASGMTWQPNAPLLWEQTDAASTRLSRVVWLGTFNGPLAELRRINERCDGQAFLRFARAPVWAIFPEHIQVGDLRYDRDRELGFAEVQLLQRDAPCPPWKATWEPPLKAVL